MAKKKVINTSKTAHVMNLISKNYDSSPESAGEESAAPAEAAAVQGETAPLGAVTPAAGTAVPLEPAVADTPAAPTLPLLSADMEITAQIKSALEDLVEDTPAPAVAESALAAEAEEAPAVEEESVPAAEAEETPAVEEESVPAAEAIPAQDDPEENICINIMQELVEQNVDHYIKMFGLCTCSRCKADVKAIALTNLVPQYVVAPRREASFRVTIYHERFHGEVTAQILQACRIVMDKPRH